VELEYSIWQVGLIALIAGALIGALAYRYFAPSKKQAEKVQSELDGAREELDDYKAGVSQHFDKTGELVNELAQNYVKVYQHLAEGSQTLGAGKSFPELLEQQNRTSIGLADDPEVEIQVTEDSAIVSEEIAEIHGPIDYVVSSDTEEPLSEANAASPKDDEPADEVARPSEEEDNTTEVTEPILDEDEDTEAKEKAEKIRNAPDDLQEFRLTVSHVGI